MTNLYIGKTIQMNKSEEFVACLEFARDITKFQFTDKLYEEYYPEVD